MKMLRDRRALPLILSLGWAAFFAIVAASDLTDLLATAGLPMTWRSGNVQWVRSGFALLGKPLWPAVALLVFATAVNLLSAGLYVRAARAVVRQPTVATAACRAAAIPGAALWLLFAIGVELLLAFEAIDTGKFFTLMIAQLATLLASAHALEER